MSERRKNNNKILVIAHRLCFLEGLTSTNEGRSCYSFLTTRPVNCPNFFFCFFTALHVAAADSIVPASTIFEARAPVPPSVRRSSTSPIAVLQTEPLSYQAPLVQDRSGSDVFVVSELATVIHILACYYFVLKRFKCGGEYHSAFGTMSRRRRFVAVSTSCVVNG